MKIYIPSTVHRRTSGFTLIELLVVVAIIALLISILMPSLSNARRQARRVACMSNLHELGIGVIMYTSEYQGKMPCRMTAYNDSFWMYNTWGTPAGPTNLGLLREAGIINNGVFWCTDGRYGADIANWSKGNFMNYAWGTGSIISTYAVYWTSYDFASMAPVPWLLIEHPNAPYMACAQYTYEGLVPGDTSYDDGFRMNPHDGQGSNVWWTDGSASWFAMKRPMNNNNWQTTQGGYFWDTASKSH